MDRGWPTGSGREGGRRTPDDPRTGPADAARRGGAGRGARGAEGYRRQPPPVTGQCAKFAGIGRKAPCPPEASAGCARPRRRQTGVCQVAWRVCNAPRRAGARRARFPRNLAGNRRQRISCARPTPPVDATQRKSGSVPLPQWFNAERRKIGYANAPPAFAPNGGRRRLIGTHNFKQ